MNYSSLASPKLLEISSKQTNKMLGKREGETQKVTNKVNCKEKKSVDKSLCFASSQTIQPATIACSLPILCTPALCICGYYLTWTRLVLTNKNLGSFDFPCVHGQREGVISVPQCLIFRCPHSALFPPPHGMEQRLELWQMMNKISEKLFEQLGTEAWYRGRPKGSPL